MRGAAVVRLRRERLVLPRPRRPVSGHATGRATDVMKTCYGSGTDVIGILLPRPRRRLVSGRDSDVMRMRHGRDRNIIGT